MIKNRAWPETPYYIFLLGERKRVEAWSREALFSVKVKTVNTLVRKGKVKRFRNKIGVRNDVKKAVVTLVDGQSIDISTGI